MSIFLGDQQKNKIIEDYANEKGISKIFVIGEDIGIGECIKFVDTIEYKVFYRLLQEVGGSTLIVLNEILKKTNRSDLHYNCIRRYMVQTTHKIIFNYFPILKHENDFMILWDMNQSNPFGKDKFSDLNTLSDVFLGDINFELQISEITFNEDQLSLYEKEKEKIILSVKKDADIIPRRLLKFVEKIKNKMQPGYDSLKSIKKTMNVLVSNTGVDKYYLSQLQNFQKGVKNVCEKIS